MITQNDDYILVANIGKPIGLKGWIKINSYTRPEENIRNYKQFFLGKKKEFVTFGQIKKSGKNLITKLNNYDSIEEVEKFKNFDVFIKSSELPELKENQFYWKDLIDMEVESIGGEFFGKVIEIIEAGSNDVIVVKDKKKKSILIPFIFGTYIKEVKENKIYVNWERDD